jgi:hypothetical protein
MPTFYVATRALYVVVDANDGHQARELAGPALAALLHKTLGREAPVEIHIIRLATADEIELMKWHDQMVASHTK